MAGLPTIEIHSPKDKSQRWVINECDYDPSRHQLWGEPELALSDEDPDVQLFVMTADSDPDDTGPPIGIDSDGNEFTQSDLDRAIIQPVKKQNSPSRPDFVEDDEGNQVAVNIINPEYRNSRKEIPLSEYDPDVHELWSTHPRFNR